MFKKTRNRTDFFLKGTSTTLVLTVWSRVSAQSGKRHHRRDGKN